MVADAGRGRRRLASGLGCCMLMLWLSLASAVDDVQLQMERVDGEFWSVKELALEIAAIADASRITVSAASLDYAGQVFRQIRLQCPEARTNDQQAMLVCKKGQLDIGDSPFKTVSGGMSWRYTDTTHWWLKLDELHFSRARLWLELTLTNGRLQADFRLNNFNLALLKPYLPKAWTLSGVASLRGRTVLSQGEPASVNLSAQLKNFSYSSEDGLQVGESLALQLKLDGARRGNIWQGKLGLDVTQGQLYSDPFFVQIEKDAPFELQLQGKLDGNTQDLGISALSFNYGKLLSGRGAMNVNLSSRKLHELDLGFHVNDLSRAYGLLVQPLVIGSALDDMTVSGQVQGRLQLGDDRLQAFSLKLQQVAVEQNAGLFGLQEINGDVRWNRSGVKAQSRLSWVDGHLFKIGFGALNAVFSAYAGDIVMEPVSLPLLGGSLRLDDLRLGGLLSDDPGWQARAKLQDIQLGALSRSLGWPALEGSLQASIPRLHYRDALLRMDGELLVDVFGGRIVVEGLKLEDPLGVAPVLETSVRLKNLDLEQITQVFDFGRIQGSLEGYIRNLQLVGWQVTAFDASLQSPKKDRRRHRISQRAIDNLTELGNGASVSLSATMLRFFEDFAYDKLALKIRLRGAVAELDGVPNPKGGYYIVKGARLPRIDVIGRNHKVAWKDLLSRIRDIRFDDMIVE
ncbi:hypothetical protein [Thiolapillus sp.]